MELYKFMAKFTHKAGEYKIVNKHGNEATVYLTKTEAKCFQNKFWQLRILGIASIEFIK